MPSFLERLQAAQDDAGSVVCVGLDPDPARLPLALRGREPKDEAVREFLLCIVEATRPFACGYKPNTAFFEALGSPGLRVLETLLDHIPEHRISIVDGKRGDIGNTARMYARFFFERLGGDACTVSPYMGRDAVTPFLEFPGRCAFVLGRTSNPGAADLQELPIDGRPAYETVARAVGRWQEGFPGTAGLVVGATDAVALERLRALLPDTPFLVPGVGAQGGSPEQVMRLAGSGPGAVVVNSSRSILYASDGDDYAEAAAAAARALRDTLRATAG